MSERRRGDLIALAVAAAVVVIDQVTKNWALNTFSYQPRHVIWTLQFAIARNTGAAFSLLSGRGVGPAIALVAVIVVVVVVRTLRFATGPVAMIASGLVVGGAIANLADRLFRAGNAGFLHGAVVDWIDFQWWPVFNVADAAITVGALMLGVAAFLSPADLDDRDDRSEDSDSPARS